MRHFNDKSAAAGWLKEESWCWAKSPTVDTAWRINRTWWDKHSPRPSLRRWWGSWCWIKTFGLFGAGIRHPQMEEEYMITMALFIWHGTHIRVQTDCNLLKALKSRYFTGSSCANNLRFIPLSVSLLHYPRENVFLLWPMMKLLGRQQPSGWQTLNKGLIEYSVYSSAGGRLYSSTTVKSHPIIFTYVLNMTLSCSQNISIAREVKV